jgi:4-hydroxybenzoate polyprenyltransferase
LPYNQKVLKLVEDARIQGRRVVLATATHGRLAEKIALHLGCFDEVLSTNETCNLSAARKRSALVERFGEKGYDYVGNSHDDVEVWRSAREAIVVNPERGVFRKAERVAKVGQVLSTKPSQTRSWFNALRLHQWTKNVLIVLPLLASHNLTDVSMLGLAVLAFLLFGLCASSVYILNDLLDLDDDRHHPTKRHRPFAAGAISIHFGVIVFPVLLMLSFFGAWVFLPPAFMGVLLAYYALTLAYSLRLKRLMAVDVIALASLYTTRIIAGAAALGLPLTFWILGFSMFIFLSLALVKRYAELRDARAQGVEGKTRGRGYYPDDLEMISSLGAASGYLSVMVLALYIQQPATLQLYAHPGLIWMACPVLLFWITRIWLLTHRGQMHDDPVIFAAKDKVSLVTGALFGLIFILAA